MWRALIILSAALAMGGCATQNYRYYGSDYYSSQRESAWESAERGGYTDAGYVNGRGGVGLSYYDYPDWVDYPYYYSLFWSFNRAWVDPYWYPNFYYGVTWYPRNYFSVSYRFFPGSRSYFYYGRPFYAYLSYSPYRYAWVDYYYDWYPWYAHYPRYHHSHYYAPRYGNSRNEAERLAHLSGAARGDRLRRQEDGSYARGWDQSQSRRDVISRRETLRGADHYSSTQPRVDPTLGGYRSGGDSRRNSGDNYRPDSRSGSADSRGEIGRRSEPTGPRAPVAASEPRPSVSPRAPTTSAGAPSTRRELEAGIPYPDRSSRPVRNYAPPVRSAGSSRSDSYPPPSDYGSRSSSAGRSRDASSYAPPREPLRYNPPPEPAPSYAPPPRADFGGGRSDAGRGAERSEPRFERSEPPPRPEPMERGDSGGGSRSEAGRFRQQED